MAAINLENKTIEEIIDMIPYGLNMRQVRTKKYSIYHGRHYNEKLGDVKFKEEKNGKVVEYIKRKNEPSKIEGQWLVKIEPGTLSMIKWNSKSEDVFLDISLKKALIKCFNYIQTLNLENKDFNE